MRGLVRLHGIVFDAGGLKVEKIRDQQQYGGVRIKTTADLTGAKINASIDIGFGDAIEPGLACRVTSL